MPRQLQRLVARRPRSSFPLWGTSGASDWVPIRDVETESRYAPIIAFMTAVFLHGAPVTPAVWRPLLDHLPGVKAVTPNLPGFGTPLPPRFHPTMECLAEWFAVELEAIEGPVDLVAQDWGALISLRVLADRPQNLRSWVLDASDLDDDFVWHESARLLQSPEGDSIIERVVAAPVDQRTALLQSAGVHEGLAGTVAEVFDRTMGDTLLSLYRSATRIGAEWGPRIDEIRGPGLVVDCGADPFRAPGSAARFAKRTGATLANRPDLGHWWMLEDPDGTARMLQDFWAGL